MIRYCQFCGKITAQKEEALFVCGDGHENWVNPAVGAVVYVVSDGKVLFGVRSIEPNRGKLALPGGFIHMHESAELAATREAKEELGIDIIIQTYIGTYASLYNGKPVLNIVYAANCTDTEVHPGDDMDGGAPVWRNIDDLPKPEELAWDWYQSAQEDFLLWWHNSLDPRI